LIWAEIVGFCISQTIPWVSGLQRRYTAGHICGSLERQLAMLRRPSLRVPVFHKPWNMSSETSIILLRIYTD